MSLNLAHCRQGRQIWLVSINIINGFMLLSTLPTIYKLIKSYMSLNTTSSTTNKKLPKSLFYIGLLFMFVSFCVLLLNLFAGVYKCSTNHQQIYYSLEPPTTQCYGIQFYLLLLLLYLRLKNVFQSTMYALSLTFVRTMNIIFIALPFLSATAGILYIFELPGGLIVVVLAFLCIFTIITTLITMYIRKLLTVYRSVVGSEEAETDSLIVTITKTTILSLLSIFATFLTLVTTTLTPILSDYMDMVAVIPSVFLFDIYTNFLCITLSYQCFSPLYMKICGCIHRRCKIVWYGIAGQTANKEKEIAIEIDSASPSPSM